MGISDKEQWAGNPGNEYTDRNTIDYRPLIPFFNSIIPEDVQSILEVGCNKGHNLMAICKSGKDFDLCGFDINTYAILCAKEQSQQEGCNIKFIVKDLFNHEMEYQKFDLVLICGVLIHIDPKELDNIIYKLYWLTKKYLLVLEYYSVKFKKIKYRDNIQLWKGPYDEVILGNEYINLIKQGEVGTKQGFGDTRNYWLFKKVE